jgi:hypothetical protein
MHTAYSLQIYIYIYIYHHIVFLYKEKFQKGVLACTLALITSLLESWELGQYFKNFKKIFLSSFSIWDYEFIRKTYSWY